MTGHKNQSCMLIDPLFLTTYRLTLTVVLARPQSVYLLSRQIGMASRLAGLLSHLF